jgi:hypothetical protein
VVSAVKGGRTAREPESGCWRGRCQGESTVRGRSACKGELLSGSRVEEMSRRTSVGMPGRRALRGGTLQGRASRDERDLCHKHKI